MTSLHRTVKADTELMLPLLLIIKWELTREPQHDCIDKNQFSNPYTRQKYVLLFLILFSIFLHKTLFK